MLGAKDTIHAAAGPIRGRKLAPLPQRWIRGTGKSQVNKATKFCGHWPRVSPPSPTIQYGEGHRRPMTIEICTLFLISRCAAQTVRVYPFVGINTFYLV